MLDYAPMLADTNYAQYYVAIMYASLHASHSAEPACA